MEGGREREEKVGEEEEDVCVCVEGVQKKQKFPSPSKKEGEERNYVI